MVLYFLSFLQSDQAPPWPTMVFFFGLNSFLDVTSPIFLKLALKFYSSCKYLFVNHCLQVRSCQKDFILSWDVDSVPHFSLQALLWFFASHAVSSGLYLCLLPFPPLTHLIHTDWFMGRIKRITGGLGVFFFLLTYFASGLNWTEYTNKNYSFLKV